MYLTMYLLSFLLNETQKKKKEKKVHRSFVTAVEFFLASNLFYGR